MTSLYTQSPTQSPGRQSLGFGGRLRRTCDVIVHAAGQGEHVLVGRVGAAAGAGLGVGFVPCRRKIGLCGRREEERKADGAARELVPQLVVGAARGAAGGWGLVDGAVAAHDPLLVTCNTGCS